MFESMSSKEIKTILVVDDNRENLLFLEKVLLNEGYRVSSLRTGKGVLERAVRVKPSLILLDVVLPDHDGYAICAHLKSKAETARVPVIFMSALTESTDRIKGFDVGGADFVSKPFELNETLARIKTHIQLFDNVLKIEKYHAALHDAYVDIEANKRRSSITMMVAGVAHQVNTPLGNCRLAANTIESLVTNLDTQIKTGLGLSRSKMENSLDQIIKGSMLLERNLRILGGLIEKFKLLHFDGERDHHDEILFRQMQNSCIEELIDEGYDSSWVEFEISTELDHTGYSSLLRTVMLELIKNAIQHGFPKDGVVPKVRVELYQLNSQSLRLIVSDNGVGISREYISQIFDPFFTTAMASGNLGLGLSLMLHLVEKVMSGRVELQSLEDVETVFTVTLPLGLSNQAF